MNILITGGLGFIGSHYIRYLLKKEPEISIVNLDAKTYAANPYTLSDVKDDPAYTFVQGDINHRVLIRQILEDYAIDQVINFAAESHVDRSISDSSPFIHTNINGVVALLDVFRDYCATRGKDRVEKRFIQISTDEVYGDGAEYEDLADERASLQPSSPYAAAKASADLIVQAYGRTYSLPVMITRSSNNYGTHQNQEKFIPTVIKHALLAENVPIYGDGKQERDWINVADHCRAIDVVRRYGEIGEIYNVSASYWVNNYQLATKILDILGKPHTLLKHVADRPGHDRSYRISSKKLLDLGWSPQVVFNQGLKETVEWYYHHLEYL